MKQIKWAPIIPLIGGFSVGAEMAIGHAPEEIYSYDGFQANDSSYVNHQQKTLGRDVKYTLIDETSCQTKLGKLNIIVATPPCAALSAFNTSKNEESRGSGCKKNEWIYRSATDAINMFDTDVYICENAPALYTNKGRGVAETLMKIAEQTGRSVSFYKTSTMYHGIPQNRDRTFAFIWKSDTSPILEWHKKPYVDAVTYVKQVDPKALQQDVVINPGTVDNPFWLFLVNKYTDPYPVMVADNTISALHFIKKNGMLQECLDWFVKTGNESGEKSIRHAMMKFAADMNVWDGSTNVICGDTIPALIARNMQSLKHPVENRSLTLREAMHFMGLPHDFELLGGKKNFNMIAQNVPTCTARDMVAQAMKFVRGELPMSNGKVVFQNNHRESIDEVIGGTIEPIAVLDDLFV